MLGGAALAAAVDLAVALGPAPLGTLLHAGEAAPLALAAVSCLALGGLAAGIGVGVGRSPPTKPI